MCARACVHVFARVYVYVCVCVCVCTCVCVITGSLGLYRETCTLALTTHSLFDSEWLNRAEEHRSCFGTGGGDGRGICISVFSRREQ